MRAEQESLSEPLKQFRNVNLPKSADMLFWLFLHVEGACAQNSLRADGPGPPAGVRRCTSSGTWWFAAWRIKLVGAQQPSPTGRAEVRGFISLTPSTIATRAQASVRTCRASGVNSPVSSRRRPSSSSLFLESACKDLTRSLVRGFAKRCAGPMWLYSLLTLQAAAMACLCCRSGSFHK